MSRRRLPDEAVTLLLHQFASGLRAGLPPLEAVDLLARSSSASSTCRDVIIALSAVFSGQSGWPEALRKLPETFPEEVADLLAHAQASGRLAHALDLVALEFEQRSQLRDSLRGALAWPLIVFGVFLVLATIQLIFVVPAFKELFEDVGSDLPAPTLALIDISDFVVRQWWVLALGLALIAVLYRARGRFAGIWPRYSKRIVKMPLVGPYLAAAFLLRSGRLLQSVVAGHLPMAPALAYLSATSRSSVLAGQSQALQKAVDDGLSLPEAVRGSLASGGDLALALEFDLRSAENGTALQHTLQLAEDNFLRQRMRLERALLITLYLLTGSLVGGFVVSMYLPLFRLGSVV